MTFSLFFILSYENAFLLLWEFSFLMWVFIHMLCPRENVLLMGGTLSRLNFRWPGKKTRLVWTSLKNCGKFLILLNLVKLSKTFLKSYELQKWPRIYLTKLWSLHKNFNFGRWKLCVKSVLRNF
jgi:hypothetical protein